MGSDADATERLIKVDATVCGAVFQTSVAARIGSGCGCNSSTRETDGECNSASDEFGSRTPLPDLPSGTQSSRMVKSQGKCNLAETTRGWVCGKGRDCDGNG